MLRHRLHANAATQSARAREHGGGEAAGGQLGAARAQEVSRGHAGKLARPISGNLLVELCKQMIYLLSLLDSTFVFNFLLKTNI